MVKIVWRLLELQIIQKLQNLEKLSKAVVFFLKIASAGKGFLCKHCCGFFMASLRRGQLKNSSIHLLVKLQDIRRE